MLRCINNKHNSSEIQLFSLSDCSVYLVTGVGGKLSRPVYLDPHSPEYLVIFFFAMFSHFKLSECDDVSIINIIQVKFSCFLCYIVSYTIQCNVKYAKKRILCCY